jgi:predicted membrane-bound spermidine synthase
VIHAVFFASGFAAVIYQVIWQRVLMALYGANVESVTIVVTAFMLGLGAGSLIGGRLAARCAANLPRLFGALELGIAACGAASLPVFQTVGEWTSGASPLVTGLTILGLLLAPTVLMGATLPILVAHAAGEGRTVGRAVGGLYSTNALGSAVGALAAVLVIFARLGQHRSVWLAVLLNVVVATVVLSWRRAPVRAA